jgi:hypothetical protein
LVRFRVKHGLLPAGAFGALATVGLGVALAGGCGLEETGLAGPDGSTNDVILPQDDGGGQDVVIDTYVDNYVPPPCTDPDASLDASCLGVAVPTGWIPVGYQLGAADGSCPSNGDFNEKPYVSDPVVTTGVTCNCTGCALSGGWTCSGTVSAGPGCVGESTSVGGTTSCWNPSSPHISFKGTLTRGGTPSCAGGTQTGTQAATTTSSNACIPTKCQSDFCGLAAHGYDLCIMNTTESDGGCPSPFSTSHVVAQSATTICDSCQQCAIGNADAGCSAALTAYPYTDCDGGSVATGNADNACHDTNPSDPTWNSLLYQPTVPTPQCGPTTNTQTGTAVLNSPFTICCKP